MTKDRENLLEEIGLASDYLATHRVWPQLTGLPVETQSQILTVLWTDLSYVPRLTADIQTDVLTAVQKRIAQYKNALRKQYSGALYQSPSPPASLREQMTRESLESVVDRFRTLSKMQEKIGLDLREAKKTRTFFRKRGDTVRKAQAKLMRLLQRSTGSRRKAGKFTVAIMKAWNPTIAPANKETARVSSLRKRQK